MGLLDLAAAAKIAGARFSVLRGDLAKLHRCLIQFMLESHLEKGYEELYVPVSYTHLTLPTIYSV